MRRLSLKSLVLKLAFFTCMSFLLIPSEPAHAQATTTTLMPDKPRVYVTDNQSWEMRGRWATGGHQNADGSGSFGGGGSTSGGARPQTAEIIKTFNQRCPQVIVTSNPDKAQFAVTLDHEGGKGYLRHRNKIVVFNRDGDAIFSDSTRELGNSVKDACKAILSSPSKK
jgi:hypothetical protein